MTFVPHLSPLMVNGSMTFQLFPSLVIAITDLSVDGLLVDGDIARSVTNTTFAWRFYSSQGLLSETKIDPIEFALSKIRNEP